ncbi:MAG: hypothetical protein RQ761_05140 [Bacteroidales bacterium]|nr:hypothetical protein [Bacteroidales bacterium]
MKKYYFFSTIYVLLLISFNSFSQDIDTEEFTPHGKPIIKIFTNIHSGLSENNDDAGFEIRRAYFGYRYHLSDNFEIGLTLDIGSPNDASEYSLLRRFAYFKNAYLKYTWNKLTTQFGIVGVYEFDIQEDYWAHRYISKSFMDEYDFGPSADLGWNIAYRFNDFVSADFGLYNGEGYTKLQADNAFKAGFGVSVFPLKGFIVRIYGDMIEKGVYQQTIAGFIGYKFKDKFIGGAEYNYQFNYNYSDGQDRYGFSVYGSYYLDEQWQLFARFDQVYSNIPDNFNQPWDLEQDGSTITGGIEYSPIKQVKIAANYQDWTPYARNLANEAYIYLNFEYKL